MSNMPDRPSLGERLRYEFDRTMSAGVIAVIGWLTVLTLIVVSVAALILVFTGIRQEGAEPVDFVEGVWEAAMRAIDPGTLGGDMGWGFRLIMLVVTLWGIFVVSALIGLMSAGVQEKLEELRKGRSNVLETGHRLILNWSPSIFDILQQLIVANAGEKQCVIVIMADKDKVEMEDEIARNLKPPRNVRIICRNGGTSDLQDLDMVNVRASRSIIILSPDAPDPDSQVIKSIIALVHAPGRRSEPYQIAAEFRNARNAEIARTVGGKEVQLVLADELISRIIVHTSRQSGLSGVYSELLDFEGSEIYLQEVPQVAGWPFGGAMHAFETSTLIGYAPPGDDVRLNPPADTVIPAGAQLVLIAEDRASIRFTPPASDAVQREAMRSAHRTARKPERTLLLDWNRRARMIVTELSRGMAPGSELVIAASTPAFEREVADLPAPGRGVTLRHQSCDTSRPSALEALQPETFDRVIVLADTDVMSPDAADTQTLVTLLHLRRIAETAGRHVSVVSEMTDVRNRELAEVAQADDFVVSNKLVSMMLAQASETRHIADIFREILDDDGCEVYMRPAEEYVATGQPVNFHTVIEAARARGEAAFGYCRWRPGTAGDGRRLAGVVLNPAKSVAVTFEPGDKIVVLSEG